MTELEVQCYLMQLFAVLKYLHGLKIVHRDIKLSNLFLNENMELKLGDFGLACKIEFEGERKRTMCGTPNYIAPEILDGRIGHSFEVDIWSFGIIAYTLLVGKPPFQGEDARATYRRIKANNYCFPDNVTISCEARDLIASILVNDPSCRLTLNQIQEHPFFMRNIIPRTLPLSTLCVPPSGGYLKQFETKGESKKIEEFIPMSPRSETSLNIRANLSPRENISSPRLFTGQNKLYVCNSKLSLESDEVWVEKWVDYSDKYGLGYKLSNGMVGAHFNDITKIILDSQGKVSYFEGRTGEEECKFFELSSFPPEIHKKITILQHFNKHLKADKVQSEQVYVRKWVSNSIAVIFRLSNRNVHVVFHDKIEILVQGTKKTVVFLENNTQSQYLAKAVPESGNQELIKRMRFVKEILTGMVNKNQ
jgi:polo-like kinase 1